jgi:hypothetical protein
MKKVMGFVALALALVACNKNEISLEPADKADGIPFSATVSMGNGLDTKALAESGTDLVATWAKGEKVALVHNGVSDEMTVSSVSAGTATITGTITGSPSNGDPVTIIYPSTASDGTTGNVRSNLLFTQDGTLTGTGGTSIAEKYDVRKGTGTLKVDGTASLDGNVSLDNQFAIFKFTVRLYDGTTAISAKPLKITVGSDTYTITPAEATDVLYAVLPAVSEQKVSFDATDDSGKTYTCAKTSVSFTSGQYYQTTLKMREYVDMGNGLKWGTMNVGATPTNNYGLWYAWGETVDKWTYNWSTYFDTHDGGNTFSKYNATGGSTTTLGLEDDVANKEWGGTWRIPTDTEWTWMRINCSWVYKKTTDGYPCKGWLVTSYSTGKSIFIPAGSHRYDNNLGSTGEYGFYWSSTLSSNSSQAFGLRIRDSWGVERYAGNRCYGYTIRPVTE